MIYSYYCQFCGPLDSVMRGDWIICEGCKAKAKRDWRFRADTFPEHFAPAFGRTISSRRQAKELAKAASAEAYLRTGLEADYQVVDAHDDAAVGIDKAEKEAAGEETRRRAVNGAAWNAKRLATLESERQAKRAAKNTKVDA